MINWVTDWCLKAGIEKICVVVGSRGGPARGAAAAVRHRQADRAPGHRPRGDDGKRIYPGKPPGDVVVLNGDAPFVSDQVIGTEHHHQSGAQVTVGHRQAP